MAIKASYSEVYDMQTKEGAISALKFHSPQDGAPAQHLGGLFAQFRKYKYLGANVAMIPAQTLPLDPLQVSYDAGDQLADPRDILNPILHKHYAGERLLLDLYNDGYYNKQLRGTKGIDFNQRVGPGQSIDEIEIPNDPTTSSNAELFYGNLLMDPSWRGAHVQAGLRVKMRPFIWDVQSTKPLGNVAQIGGSMTAANFNAYSKPMVAPARPSSGASPANVTSGKTPMWLEGDLGTGFSDDWQFIGSGTMPLNWLPTNPAMGAFDNPEQLNFSEVTRIRVPKIYMHVIILPPAFKASFYYRMVVKHKFLFKDMSSLASIDSVDVQALYQHITSRFTAPTAKSRLNAIGESSEYVKDDGSGTMDISGMTLRKTGGYFDYEEGVNDDDLDLTKAPNVKTLDDMIEELEDKNEDKE